MRRYFHPSVQLGVVVGILALTGMAVNLPATADPGGESYLLKISVEKRAGDDVKEKVNISLPISMFQLVFNLLPTEVKKILDDKEIKLDNIVKELEKLETRDLVKVTGKGENVRIYLDPVNDDNRKDLGFVKVNVVDTREEKEEVSICIPRGLFQIASEVIKALGLPDKVFNEEIKKELGHIEHKEHKFH